MSAINEALPRMRAAIATEIEEVGEMLVPFSINTRTNATICRATKKKIVGGSNAKNSSLSLVNSLGMELAFRVVAPLASSQTSASTHSTRARGIRQISSNLWGRADTTPRARARVEWGGTVTKR